MSGITSSKSVRVWIALLFALICIFAVPFFPILYNSYFTSLGRFSATVSVGDSETRVDLRMKEFQEQHDHNTIYRERVARFDLYGESIDPTRVVSLRQESIFDDIEFQVLFSNGAVAQTVYVGD